MLKYDNYIIQPMQKFILGKKKKKQSQKPVLHMTKRYLKEMSNDAK